MLAPVNVLNANDFTAWVAEQKAAVSPLFGSQREFTDGASAVADEEYIRNSILNSNGQIVAGYPPVMPQNYADVLSDQQLDALVEYIKTLE